VVIVIVHLKFKVVIRVSRNIDGLEEHGISNKMLVCGNANSEDKNPGVKPQEILLAVIDERLVG
jgi:hypothetical protein